VLLVVSSACGIAGWYSMTGIEKFRMPLSLCVPARLALEAGIGSTAPRDHDSLQWPVGVPMAFCWSESDGIVRRIVPFTDLNYKIL